MSTENVRVPLRGSLFLKNQEKILLRLMSKKSISGIVAPLWPRCFVDNSPQVLSLFPGQEAVDYILMSVTLNVK